MEFNVSRNLSVSPYTRPCDVLIYITKTFFRANMWTLWTLFHFFLSSPIIQTHAVSLGAHEYQKHFKCIAIKRNFAKDSTEHSWLYMPNLYMQNERQSRSKINARIFVRIRNWHNNTIMYPTLFCTRVTTFRKTKQKTIVLLLFNFQLKRRGSMLWTIQLGL